jgi:hypothetical protein
LSDILKGASDFELPKVGMPEGKTEPVTEGAVVDGMLFEANPPNGCVAAAAAVKSKQQS